ncbi:MAG TPA: penicillin-binding protein 2 [Mycobacteriales bacterium]|nr:penicillin-binding protein 2 [Mycobacteriales bacterium]
MNAALRRVAVAALVLFGLLFANLHYVQVVAAERLRNDDRNARLLAEAYERERGVIVVGTRAIAKSVATEGRLKYLRVYADGRDAGLAASYAPLTGYLSLIYGDSGIEESYGDVLSGADSRLFVRRVTDVITGRKSKGGVVRLTVDAELQSVAQRALGARRGAVVALDPRSGAILAMVTSPSYDPNTLSSHDPARIRASYKKLTDDRRRPLVNRATQETYPPGSTFKIVTAAAALESGLRLDSMVPCPKELKLPLTRDTVIRNFDNVSCEAPEVTLAAAFQKSRNTSFAALGLSLGGERLREQAERFGFGARPDFPLPLARSVVPEGLNEPQSAQSAIGQFDVRATPLQMALVAAGVANRGVVMRPYLVSSVEGPDLKVLDRTEPEAMGGRAVSERTAAALAQLMELAVSPGGTGVRAAVPGRRVAGKTGTAQRGEGQLPHAWFVGFAPVEAPQIVVAVIVEEGGGERDATGGRVAAPIAGQVLQAGLRR